MVRQEADGVRCYAHIGTGNYHVRTARLYIDLGLFTCNPVLTGDLVDLFNFLTGYSLKRNYQTLLISPMTMRARFLEMIEREIAHHQAGRRADHRQDEPARGSSDLRSPLRGFTRGSAH